MIEDMKYVIYTAKDAHSQLSILDKKRLAYLIKRVGGFPAELRPLLWRLASGGERAKKNNPGYYFRGDGEERIRPLLSSYEEMPESYKEQIELDIKRTFTDDTVFVEDRELQKTVRNVLLGYAKRNTSIGYGQGMNYLGGLISRVVRNEEDSFWVLTNLFESILPLDYYCLMTEILVDQRVFTKIFKKK